MNCKDTFKLLMLPNLLKFICQSISTSICHIYRFGTTFEYWKKQIV